MTKTDRKCILKEEKASIDEQQTDWASIYVASVLSFVGSCQFSIYFSSLWPYLQLLDASATESFFGYVIAIYSLGQIFSSPTFGYWSNRIKQVRLPLFTGLALMFIGNGLYIALELVTFSRKYLMLVCRCITGMGSGNVSLLRTYASTASTDKDRPKAIAYVTCGQALGTTAGPALQLLFTPLAENGFRIFDTLTISMYTAPAYLACSMNFLGAMALYFLFRENYAGIVDEENEDPQKQDPKKSSTSIAAKIPPYDIISVLVCYATRFTQMFINTNLETIGSPFAMMMFAWTETKAVTFTAAAQGAVGVFTFLTYLMYILMKMDKVLNCRVSCMISLVALILFHLVTYSWPFLPGTVLLHRNTEIYNETEQHVGCNVDKFSWCEELKQVNVYLYYVAYIVVIGLAFPTLNITLATLFSKILGPRRQGTQQGILQMSGSVARMVGPILISVLYTAYGPRMAWHMEILFISITLFLWIFFYQRMVPLKTGLQLDSISVQNNKSESGIIPRVKSNSKIRPCEDEDKTTTMMASNEIRTTTDGVLSITVKA